MPPVFHSSIFTLRKSTFNIQTATALAEKVRDTVPGIISLHAGCGVESLRAAGINSNSSNKDEVLFGLVVRVLTEGHEDVLRKHHAYVDLVNYLHHHSVRGKVSVDFTSLGSNL